MTQSRGFPTAQTTVTRARAREHSLYIRLWTVHAGLREHPKRLWSVTSPPESWIPGNTPARARHLPAHRLVECERQGDGKAHRWKLAAFARERMETFPEMSSSTRSGRDKGFSATLTFRERSPLEAETAAARERPEPEAASA